MNKRAFTIVEVILSVVVISIAFYSLIGVFSLVASKSVDSETAVTASYLLQGKMDEAVARLAYAKPVPDLHDPAKAAPIVVWTCFDNRGDPMLDPLDYPGQFSAYWYQIKMEYIDKDVDPIAVKPVDQGNINDLRKLTIEIAKKDAYGNILFLRSFVMIMPSLLDARLNR